MPSILVIEQNPALGQLFETALRGAGYTVYLATGPEAAHELLHRVAVEMVITDLNLPSGAGLEIVTEVRDQFPGTKIVGISGEAIEFDPMQAAPLLDSVEVLRNPIGINHLLGTVQRVLGYP
jgi:DNA-binding NtrC family response regulator